MILPQDILTKKTLSWTRLVTAFIVMICAALLTTIFFAIILEFAFGKYISSDVVLNFFTFLSVAVWHIPMAFALWLFFGRKYLSIINPLKFDVSIEVKWAIIFAVSYLVIADITNLIFLGETVSFHLIWDAQLWFTWLLPIGMIVLLQTSAEEFLFRGILQQYLAGKGAHKLVYILIPTFIWTALHFWNFSDPWLKFAAITQLLIMGVIWADWADRTRTLWGPIIIHFINNIYLTILIGNDLEPSELNIFQAKINTTDFSQIAISSSVVSCLLAIAYYTYVRHQLPDRRDKS